MPYLQLNYKKIHYTDTPPADGATPTRTLVLMHGLGSSENYYYGMLPLLTKADYRVITFDTTGSGRSPYTWIEQSTHSLAQDVIALMDGLKLPKAVIAGHSMGGFVVPHVAATWPDRVEAIVLFGPVYPSEAAVPIFEKRIAAVEAEGMQPMADTIPYAAVGSKATSLQHAFIRELLLGQNPSGYVSLCRVIAGAASSPPKYGKISCPVLIIAGEEDKSAPLQGCEKVISEVSSEKKTLEVLKYIGHWMCLEVPDDVGSRMVKFLKELSL